MGLCSIRSYHYYAAGMVSWGGSGRGPGAGWRAYAKYAVGVVEGAWLGWATFGLLLSLPLLSDELRIKNETAERLGKLPVELVDEAAMEGPEVPDLARGLLAATALYSLLQLAAIVAFVTGLLRLPLRPRVSLSSVNSLISSRSSKPVMVTFWVWILVSNIIIIAGLIYAAVQVDHFKDNIPPAPALRFKVES